MQGRPGGDKEETGAKEGAWETQPNAMPAPNYSIPVIHCTKGKLSPG